MAIANLQPEATCVDGRLRGHDGSGNLFSGIDPLGEIARGIAFGFSAPN